MSFFYVYIIKYNIFRKIQVGWVLGVDKKEWICTDRKDWNKEFFYISYCLMHGSHSTLLYFWNICDLNVKIYNQSLKWGLHEWHWMAVPSCQVSLSNSPMLWAPMESACAPPLPLLPVGMFTLQVLTTSHEWGNIMNPQGSLLRGVHRGKQAWSSKSHTTASILCGDFMQRVWHILLNPFFWVTCSWSCGECLSASQPCQGVAVSSGGPQKSMCFVFWA